MPATITTKEIIADDVTDADIQREIVLRIKAGAIRARIEKNEKGQRTLLTEWNVIGEQ